MANKFEVFLKHLANEQEYYGNADPFTIEEMCNICIGVKGLNVDDDLRRYLSQCKKHGYMENVKHGTWNITLKGREFCNSHDIKIEFEE